MSRSLFPLSFAQQRLWFLSQLEPGSAAYNVPLALRLRGALNEAAVARALNGIMARHEPLRTRIVCEDGHPLQIVTPAQEVELLRLDLTNDPERLETILQQQAVRPFDLSRDALMRAVLIRLMSDDHVLLINTHHIAADEWSLEILLREFAALYQSVPLPDLPIRYADFARWQKDNLSGDFLARQMAYWKKQLNGEWAALELPADRARPETSSRRGAIENWPLPPALGSAVAALARREGVTPFMLLLAAFQTWLFRQTGQEDIIVGSPIAGRSRPETEGLIGFFVNTLPFRANFAGAPGFRQLLRQVRETALGAYANQDLPFEKLVEELRPGRAAGLAHFPGIVFACQGPIAGNISIPGLPWEHHEIKATTCKFDLTFTVRETASGPMTMAEYNADLFDAPAVRRWLAQYQTLLEGIVAQPDACVASLPLLTGNERRHLVAEMNQTWTAYPREACIHELFEEQVRCHPDATALSFGKIQLTYRQLDGRANGVAAYLRALGVAPGGIVAIWAERSVETIAGLLGILKAGGAYLPLEPGCPAERLSHMLADARPATVLTQQQLAAVQPASPPAEVSRAADLAYVMYTSGSTGRPKGVVIPHRAVVRLVKGANYAQFSPKDVFLQFAPASFDASTLEIWGSLLNGGRLVIFPPGLPSLEELGEVIRREKVTTLWLTAGLFHQMVEHQLDDLKGVRQLLAGGDVLSVPHVLKAVQNLPDCTIINGYGPTENTTFTTCFPVSRDWEGGRSVPIGRPISNTQVYVLDAKMEPVPQGVVGELYTGGDGVGRGYLNAPELTAEKFVPDPFSPEPGKQLYRTGDLVRFREDGNLEFMGREDQQVKIRGFRVELGEIEAALRRHPRVAEAVVMAQADAAGEKRLVGYVTPKKESGAETSDIQSFLKQTLPGWMLPSDIVLLDEIPLTPRGKVDRRALPAPIRAATGTGGEPCSELERQLQQVWGEVLNIPGVGVGDNFFDLGGHSLLAVRLFARMERKTGRKLPLASLFQSPTIEQLARRMEEGEHKAMPSLVEIQPGGSRPPIFWVHNLGGGGGGGLFAYRALAQMLGEDQPSYGLVAPAEPLTEIELMAERYIEAMRTVQPVGPYHIGGYCFGGVVVFEMARQLKAQGHEVGMAALLESALPHWKNTPSVFSAAVEALRNPRKAVDWLRRKAIVMQKKLAHHRSQPARNDAADALLDKLVDMSQYPKDYRHAAQVHFRALLRYRPGMYPGRLTLFRARNARLSWLNPEAMWRTMAAQVDLKLVPGTHETILEPPGVRELARQLKECLEEAQPAEARVHAA